MNVLLALDYYTITVGRGYVYTDQINLLGWLIQLVDSELIQIWYRSSNEATSAVYKCSLLDLPNWAYSYALALFDLCKALEAVDNNDENDDSMLNIKSKANVAIQEAMSRYPSVVGHLLHNLVIDTTGRSFRRDWVTVLDKTAARARELVREWHSTSTDSSVLSATLRTCDLVAKIYVQQNAKLYGDEDVLQWMYDNLLELQTEVRTNVPAAPSPAIMRYSKADPADYDVKIQTLPLDADVIDDGLVAHAMIINPNRPRYVRRQARRNDRENNDNIHNAALGNHMHQHQTPFFGPPTEMIDPDWPMAEVFWRSLLPWNYVEGIPPPRR
jgi:Transcriptional repressor TCF25